MGFSRLFGREGRLERDILAKVEKMTSKNKSNPKKEEVTLKKKLLILDYLGIIKSLDMENTKKAKLLSILLNQSEQNIREYLSVMFSSEPDIKTKENLNYVLTIFDELNLTTYKNHVIRDIEKFLKKDKIL